MKKRKQDAGEPTKYMGCGVCDNLSHSTTVLAMDEMQLQLFFLIPMCIGG